MIDPGIVAIAAVAVTLLLGVLTPLFTLLDSRAKARRENAQRRNEAYVELLRIVERRGLAVEDQAYNLTEASFDAHDPIRVQQRRLSLPPRSDRAEARALAGSHGTPAIRRDLAAWLAAVDAWEAKVTDWIWDIENVGPTARSSDEAEPEVSAEREARERLSATVGAAIAAHG